MDTNMIARNEYSEGMGMAQMKRDVDECGTHAALEKRRLTAELYGDDTYFADQERRQAAGAAVGKEIGKEMVRPDLQPGTPPRRRANGEFNSERVAGDAGAAAVGFLWSALTSDSSKHEHRMLAIDLDKLDTWVRFKNSCLRAKGYEVPEFEEDGAATAYLLGEPLRVMLRHEDGREAVMYQRPRPDDD